MKKLSVLSEVEWIAKTLSEQDYKDTRKLLLARSNITCVRRKGNKILVYRKELVRNGPHGEVGGQWEITRVLEVELGQLPDPAAK